MTCTHAACSGYGHHHHHKEHFSLKCGKKNKHCETSLEKYLPMVLLAGFAATLFIAMAVTGALARRKRRRRKRGAMGNYGVDAEEEEEELFLSESFAVPAGPSDVTMPQLLDTLWSGECCNTSM